jgi:aryl-alcohol dehydrogenase-like predicted oxidoreductase
VNLHDGIVVPALGQGSARLGQGRHPASVEEDALREGISLGMTLIDTAEIYGNGDAEKLIGRVIAGRREQVFLVSKVWPSHVAGDGIERACEGSLARLGTDHLDLYLLHWPDEITDLSGVVAAFENLRSKGKIRAWGAPISTSATWKGFLVFRTAIAAQLIKFPTVLVTAPLNMTCCRGVRSTQYQ